jgi:hypothetical protein
VNLAGLADRAARSFEVRSKRALRRAVHVGHWGAPYALTPDASLRYRLRMQRLFSRDYRAWQALGERVTGDDSFTIPEETAFAQLDARSLEVVEQATARCEAILAATRETGGLRTLPEGKNYLVRLPLSASDRSLESPLVRVALHPKLLAPTARYLGVLPVLREVILLYSPNDVPLASESPQPEEYNSQFAHVDEPADRHMRTLLHVSNVTADAGPFHAVPGRDSDAITTELGRSKYLNRLSDEELRDVATRALGREPEIRQALGPPGTVTFADSCRLWHYGSRESSKPRLLLSIWYCHPFSANFLPPPLLRFNRALLEFPALRDLAARTSDPVERAVLGGVA